MTDSLVFDAIVLAGGRGSRLGLVDKATLDVGDGPLLDRVLEAVSKARRIAVVGPQRELPPTVRQVRENPVFGGPTAAVVTGLQVLADEPSPWTVVLGCDLPLAGEAVPLLLADPERDGATLKDGNGRTQWVAGIYRSSSLYRAADALGDPTDQPLRALLGGLDVRTVTAPGRVSQDVDTWDHVSDWNEYFTEGEADE